MNSVILSMPLPYTKQNNILIIKPAIAKEVVIQTNGLPKVFCVQVNGATEWATLSSVCKLTKQAIYKTKDNFVVLPLC